METNQLIDEFIALQFGTNIPVLAEVIAKWEVYRTNAGKPVIDPAVKYRLVRHATGFATLKHLELELNNDIPVRYRQWDKDGTIVYVGEKEWLPWEDWEKKCVTNGYWIIDWKDYHDRPYEK